MIRRKELIALEQWAKKGDRKPLVLRGARQVGKTTLVKDFSKNFETFLYLNLDRPQIAALFDDDVTTEELLTRICFICDKPKGKRTLLFIDEIQNSPKAVARLRYFYEDMPQLYVIAAGSLLESLIDIHISFPVGRVEYLVLRPCNFLEYLQAVGKEIWVDYIRNRQISAPLHSAVMKEYLTYTLIGGMPEVVASFAENRDIVALNPIYESLLTGYRDDVEKYAKNKTNNQIIRHILNMGWTRAAERITLGNFGESSYKAREVGEAFRVLEKTMLLELVYPFTGFQIPIIQEKKRAPKLLWFDTGLVNYASSVQQELLIENDIMDAWRGKISEQIVGQELLSLDNRPSYHRNYWVRNANGVSSEIDFLIQHENLVIPIKVKSGHNSKLKSLHVFMKNVNHQYAVRVWAQPFSIDKVHVSGDTQFSLINIPFYYISQINSILDEVINN